MELTDTDKQRIEQYVYSVYPDRLSNQAERVGCRIGAEYATKYEREQWEEWRTEAESKLIEYGKFVSDVETERTELRNKVIDECLEKLIARDAITNIGRSLLNSLKTK